MKRLCAALLIGVVCLWPSAAFAQLDTLWEWAEHWSGPGPWDEKGFNIRVHCWTQEERAGATPGAPPVKFQMPHSGCWRDEVPTAPTGAITSYVDIRVSFAETGGAFYNKAHPRFEDDKDTRIIKAYTFEPTYMVRVTPVLDLGAGAGFMVFSGSGFNAVRKFISTPFIVSIAPLAALHPEDSRWRFLKFRFEEQFYPWGFDAKSDFGSTISSFRSYNEWARSAGFSVDLFAVGRALKH
jgi:hypothetical protein